MICENIFATKLNVASNIFPEGAFYIYSWDWGVRGGGLGNKIEGLDWLVFPVRWSHIFLLFIDASAWGINVYLDLMSHQKHDTHSSLAAVGLNEAWPFLQERLKPQAFSPRGAGQEMRREQKIYWTPSGRGRMKNVTPFTTGTIEGPKLGFYLKKSRT